MCCFSALFIIVSKRFVELCEVLIYFPGELCSVYLVIVSQCFPNRVRALSCSSGIDVILRLFCSGGKLKVYLGRRGCSVPGVVSACVVVCRLR